MAKLVPVFLDFETWWSTTHSLTKMPAMSYVMHPETEIISLATKVGSAGTNCIFGEDNIRKAIKAVDWSDKMVIAHNMSGFDSMICAWRFGMKPAMWGCTLAMARPIHAKQAGGSLKALVEHYGLGVKDNSALVNTKGKHLKDFTQDEIEAMRVYNKMDTEQCAALFNILLPLTSKSEMKLIDMTIRMLVEPQFVVDKDLLTRTLHEEQERKHQSLLSLAGKIGVTGDTDEEIAEAVRTTLASAPKFGELLESLGVEIPLKVSPTTGKEIPALAKTDEGFIALQEHNDPLVSAAAAARLGVKSTLLETRIEAFLAASDAVGGKLPIPIHYYGADTTGRDSGWAYNPQNLPRVSGKPSDALRNSLKAPYGQKVVVADLSGIELRVNHFLWKVPSSMALYQADPEKADLYKDFACMMYGITPEEVTKGQRQYAKACQLGLGFGAGAATFVRVAKTMGGIVLELDESKTTVDKWRSAYSEIKAGWKTCQNAIRNIAAGIEAPIDPWELCWSHPEGIRTPHGMIRYPNLHQEVSEEDGKKEWWYGQGRHRARLTGPKICENIVQHLARNVVMGNALTVKKLTGYIPAHRVHDELVYIVHEDQAQDVLDVVQETMRTPPVWWPELIVYSEGDIADTYGGAKG